MARNRPRRPREDEPDWPEKQCAHPDAEAVRLLVHNLDAALARSDVSGREVARRAGVDNAVILRLRQGEAWPEVTTVVRLERALGERVWPDHLGPVPSS